MLWKRNSITSELDCVLTTRSTHQIVPIWIRRAFESHCIPLLCIVGDNEDASEGEEIRAPKTTEKNKKDFPRGIIVSVHACLGYHKVEKLPVNLLKSVLSNHFLHFCLFSPHSHLDMTYRVYRL